MNDDHDEPPLATWAFGYCAARGYRAPVPALNGRSLWFDVGKPGQQGRYVLVGQGIETLAEITEPDVYVEIAGSREVLLAQVPAAWQPRTPAFLMGVAGRWWEPLPPPPRGFEVEVRLSGQAVELILTGRDGELAARGVAGLVGRTVVYDQIVTEPAYQRRGLGTFVMRQLARHAVDAGATQHLLIATEEGHALYGRLGWTVLSDVVSLMAAPLGSGGVHRHG